MQNMTEEILTELWDASPGEWVSTPQKLITGEWVNNPMRSKREEALPERLLSLKGAGDVYFSPLTFDTPSGRRANNIRRAGVIYADLDRGKLPHWPLLPNLLVASGSDDHYHAYWILEEAAPIAEWSRYARYLTQVIGADPGGWDVTQVLRVPWSLNYKGAHPSQVQVIRWNNNVRYRLEDFPRPDDSTAPPVYAAPVDEADTPVPSRSDAVNAWHRVRHLLPREVVGALAGEKVTDRSKVVWSTLHAIKNAGGSMMDAFNLVFWAPFNKYEPARLWRQAEKVYRR